MPKIKVSDEVLDRIEERLPQTDFDSSSEYVEYVLRELLNKLEEKQKKEKEEEDVDEEKVRERLRSLGYLD